MKKFLAIAGLFLLCLTASAQIENIRVTEAENTIAYFRMGACSLYEFKGVYAVRLSTSNRFDDMYVVHLGNSRESATKTLFDLVQLHHSMKRGESASFTIFTNGLAEVYKVYKPNNTSFWFIADGYAGEIYFSKYEMNNLIDRLCEERK